MAPQGALGGQPKKSVRHADRVPTAKRRRSLRLRVTYSQPVSLGPSLRRDDPLRPPGRPRLCPVAVHHEMDDEHLQTLHSKESDPPPRKGVQARQRSEPAASKDRSQPSKKPRSKKNKAAPKRARPTLPRQTKIAAVNTTPGQRELLLIQSVQAVHSWASAHGFWRGRPVNSLGLNGRCSSMTFEVTHLGGELPSTACLLLRVPARSFVPLRARLAARRSGETRVDERQDGTHKPRAIRRKTQRTKTDEEPGEVVRGRRAVGEARSAHRRPARAGFLARGARSGGCLVSPEGPLSGPLRESLLWP